MDVVRREAVPKRRFSGTWTTLSTLLRKKSSQMSEGRRSQVVLLDERRLDIVIQSRLYAGELLDIVASHFNLKEKEYFGLSFLDDSGQHSWLHLDKRVLEHDFPKKQNSQASTLVLYFRIKYFVESITQLRDSATIEAFYLQTKSLIAKGDLEIDSEIVFQLAALVIQATYGDFTDDQAFKLHLKRLPVLPTATLKEFPSIAICESHVLDHYKVLTGQTRGAAIVNYLSIVESVPTYGQHYYEIKDKAGNPCWLSLSYRGVSQYDKNDRRTPRRVFLWKQLENLYFRDKKFTVEVHEARRVVHTLSSFNLYEDAIEEPVEKFDDLSNAICDPTTQVSVSRRALAPASVTVYVWYAASPSIAKCIWSMAIAQHQFFLDRNHKKSSSRVNRSLSQIASELCRSVQSLSSASSHSNISRSNSSASLPTIIIEGELSEESKAATVEMLSALQSRKDALQDTLKKKNEELKALCLKEGELTGELPPETPFQPGEAQPQVRRRIGTSFTISDKIFYKTKGKDRETLNDLELDYEIQSKIASAAFKLANDITARKSVRKIRKVSYLQATSKLRDIEEKLSTLKREKDSQKKEQNTEGTLSNGLNFVGLPSSSSETSISSRSNLKSSLINSSVLPSTSLPHLIEGTCCSAPPSPAKFRQRHQSLQHVPIATDDTYEDVIPFNVNTRRNSSSHSAASEYDAISCGSSSIASLGIPYRNRFEASLDIEGTNHYSVPNRRASQAFNDPDDTLSDAQSHDAISHCVDGTQPGRYLNTPLSCSYDDRLTFNQAGGFSLSAKDSSYDGASINSNNGGNFSCSDSSYRLQCNSVQSEKFIHSFSENSLHRSRSGSLHRKLSQMHISEPDLNHDNVDVVDGVRHVYSVPTIRHLRTSGSQNVSSSNPHEFSTGAKNQTITQVVDLVHASVLLQDRAMSSVSLESNVPKSKTKEWIETSLDSPMVTKRRKNKVLSEACSKTEPALPAQWLENGLPSATDHSDSYYNHQHQQTYYEEHDFDLRESPSPLLAVGTSADYRNMNVKGVYQPQISYERPASSNGQPLYANGNHYRHYENIEELSSASPNHAVSQSNSYYENLPGLPDYNSSNYKFVSDSPESCAKHLNREENRPGLSIAQPQEPPKRPTRRIVADCFAPEDVPDISGQDFHDDLYEPVTYREMPHHNMHSQPHCDSYQYPHSYHSETSEQEKISQSTHQHAQNWPVMTNPTRVENPHLYHSESLPSELENALNACNQKAWPVLANPAKAESPHSYHSESLPLEHEKVSNASNHQHVQNWPVLASPGRVENPPVSPVPSQSFSPSVEVNVVSVGHFQPYWEETKPYEISDFYKYSTKHRRQQKQSPNANNIQSNDEPSDASRTQFFNPGQELGRPSSVIPHSNNVGNQAHQHQELAYDNKEFLDASAHFYENSPTPVLRHPEDPDKSLSLGEVGLRISLADTFHDEMVAWYQNQDSVKKATLV